MIAGNGVVELDYDVKSKTKIEVVFSLKKIVIIVKKLKYKLLKYVYISYKYL